MRSWEGLGLCGVFSPRIQGGENQTLVPCAVAACRVAFHQVVSWPQTAGLNLFGISTCVTGSLQLHSLWGENKQGRATAASLLVCAPGLSQERLVLLCWAGGIRELTGVKSALCRQVGHPPWPGPKGDMSPQAPSTQRVPTHRGIMSLHTLVQRSWFETPLWNICFLLNLFFFLPKVALSGSQVHFFSRLFLSQYWQIAKSQPCWLPVYNMLIRPA